MEGPIRGPEFGNSDESDGSMPGLVPVSDSNDELDVEGGSDGDWFSEVGEDTDCSWEADGSDCESVKATRKPGAKVPKGERAMEFGGEVHSDLWGPTPVATKTERRCYITFTDDTSRPTHLYLFKTEARLSKPIVPSKHGVKPTRTLA